MLLTHLPPDQELFSYTPHSEDSSHSTNVYGSENEIYCCVNSHVSFLNKGLLKVTGQPHLTGGTDHSPAIVRHSYPLIAMGAGGRVQKYSIVRSNLWDLFKGYKAST